MCASCATFTLVPVYTFRLDLLVHLCDVHEIRLYPTSQMSDMCASLQPSVIELLFFFQMKRKSDGCSEDKCTSPGKKPCRNNDHKE